MALGMKGAASMFRVLDTELVKQVTKASYFTPGHQGLFSSKIFENCQLGKYPEVKMCRSV